MDKRIRLLLDAYDEAFDCRSWHGTNLRGSIRGLTAEDASWRPSPRRHNIWEVVVHAAYWKYIVRRRLTGEKRGSFALKGSNWFRRPLDRSRKAWIADCELLENEHRLLRRVIASLDPRKLRTSPAGSQFTVEQTIRGVAAHDLYHAGQIQLLKRFLR
jgi:hypothetical protein